MIACSESETSRLCNEQARSYCEFSHDCCVAAERASFLSEAALLNYDTCLDEVTPLICGSQAEFSEAEREGRALADREAVQEEIDRLSKASRECDANEMLRGFMSPREVIEGQVEDGGLCYRDFECVGDLVCVTSSESRNIDGVCEPAGLEGESCTNGFACAEGLECDFDEVCIALPVAGESCEESFQCTDEAFCNFDFPALCEPRRSIGAACESGECEMGAFCEESVCVAEAAPSEAFDGFCDARN